tara:strand:- start:98 stop:280 length:183 start_codon:yes stop_codon:yes gene_type:complete
MSKLKEYLESAKKQAVEYKALEEQKFEEYEHCMKMKLKAEGAYEALSQVQKEEEKEINNG